MVKPIVLATQFRKLKLKQVKDSILKKLKLFMRSLVFFVVFVTVLCGFTGTDAARGQGQRPKAKEVEVEMGKPEWWWWNMILATVDSIKFGLHCTMFENEATSASA